MVKHTIMEDISGETGSVNAELKTYDEKITTLQTKWNDAKKKKKKNASLEKFSTYFTDHKEKKVRKKISKTFVLNKYITWPNLILTMEKKTTIILQQ